MLETRASFQEVSKNYKLAANSLTYFSGEIKRFSGEFKHNLLAHVVVTHESDDGVTEHLVDGDADVFGAIRHDSLGMPEMILLDPA